MNVTIQFEIDANDFLSDTNFLSETYVNTMESAIANLCILK